jgi:membrane-bound lytic murein transglycosylase D
MAGVEYDLPVHDYEGDERVARYLSLFTGRDREEFTAQLERGTRYDAMIRAKLHAAGLPEDLRYLALIESGYDPQATSRVGAVGMWQFMAGTAREIGLRVDWWVDERRDPVRATDAAARNLRWLRSQFGSIFLAAAAYNSGETRITRGLAQLAVDDSVRTLGARLDGAAASAMDLAVDSDSAPPRATAPTIDADSAAPTPAADTSGDARYFALASGGYLRQETKNYVPQLIAALLAAKEPSRYGLTVRPQAPYAYDSIRVAPLTPLAAVASAADVSRERLLDLNPHLLRGLTPPGAPTAVRVPTGTAAATARRLDDLDADALRAFRRVTTKKHETLGDLADRAGVPLRVVQRYNPSIALVRSGKWKGRVVSGQSLRVPTRAVLAFARDVPDGDGPSLAALPMPAGPTHAAEGVKADSTKARPKKSDGKLGDAKPSHDDVPNAKKSGSGKAKKGDSAKTSGAKKSRAPKSAPKAKKAHEKSADESKHHAKKGHGAKAPKSASRKPEI